jgi:hypothetical protein
MKMNKLMMIALALGSAIPSAASSQIAAAVPAPAQYKVTTFLTIDRSGDGPFDNTLEVYGEVRVNGVVNSSISRGNPRKREAGQTLNMGDKIVTGNNVSIFASLMDRDDGTPDDRVYLLNTTQINLAATAGSEKTFPFRSNAGDEGATLHVRVDRL